jgi:hypothetical protein
MRLRDRDEDPSREARHVSRVGRRVRVAFRVSDAVTRRQRGLTRKAADS